MASVVYTFTGKPKATAYTAGRNGLLPAVLRTFTVYNTKYT